MTKIEYKRKIHFLYITIRTIHCKRPHSNRPQICQIWTFNENSGNFEYLKKNSNQINEKFEIEQARMKYKTLKLIT